MALHPGFVTSATTTALDTRLGEMGWVVRNADGSPRLGVLWDAAMNAFLVLTTATTNPMTLTIPASSFIVSRGTADGIVKITNDGNVNVNVATAPATGQSRIDVVWVKQDDATQGDADNLAVFGITTGTAATTGSQAKPAIPTGALELAQLLIAGGTTSTGGSGATLTQTFAYTGHTGGIIPFRSMAELKAWSPESATYARQISPTGTVYIFDAGTSLWRPLNTTVFSNYAGNGTIVSSLTEQTVSGTNLSQYTNDNDILDATGGTILVKADGWYKVSGSIAFALNATGIRQIELNVNDNPPLATIGASATALSGVQTWLSFSGVIFVSAGNNLKLKGIQNSGSSLSYNTSLTVELLR